ncbi:MAG: hypothetical protein WDZ41_04255 [Candidatus Babeliales bacterium]
MKKILYGLLTLLMVSLNSIYALEETQQIANETKQIAQKQTANIKNLQQLSKQIINQILKIQRMAITSGNKDITQAITDLQNLLNLIFEKLQEAEDHSQKMENLATSLHKNISEVHQAAKAAQSEGRLIDYSAF